MKTQSVLVPKDKFKKSEAIKWIKKHGFKLTKIDETDKFYRFRQARNFRKYKYITLILNNDIHLVLYRSG